MKKFIYKIWSKFLTAFGNVKIFKWPCFFVYDPTAYEISGGDTIRFCNCLQPGDIILRGYQAYLDGKFIPSKAGWSHGAIYVGDNTIVHAVAEGVSKVDVIEFSRCDRLAVLRPKKYQKTAVKTALKFAKENIPYDYGFERGVSALYCFELCAECYPKLDIRRKSPTALFGLIKKKDVFLAESLLESPDLECVYMRNPKFGVDFEK